MTGRASSRSAVLALAFAALTACASSSPTSPAAASGAAEACADRARLDARLETLVQTYGLEGGVLIVAGPDGELYRRSVGGYTPDSRVRVASATKWISAAALLRLSDRGEMTLDAPLRLERPVSFSLRQALSHTSGAGVDHLIEMDPRGSLQEEARLLADNLAYRPGSSFAYSGVAFQVAGAAAERAAGKSWRQIVQDEVFGPLGIEDAYFSGTMRDARASEVTNPSLGAGLAISADDYMKFLRAVATGRTPNGDVFLSSGAMAEMTRLQTAGAAERIMPPAAPRDWGYGLGVWCETSDAAGRCRQVSSLGAWGAFPWLDLDSGRYGFLLVHGVARQMMPDLLALRELARTGELRCASQNGE